MAHLHLHAAADTPPAAAPASCESAAASLSPVSPHPPPPPPAPPRLRAPKNPPPPTPPPAPAEPTGALHTDGSIRCANHVNGITRGPNRIPTGPSAAASTRIWTGAASRSNTARLGESFGS